MSETRSHVRDCVYHNPGIHFNGISRKLDIATGQTQYHLRKLLGKDRLQSEEICGRTHYFPPTYSSWERGVIALLRRETTREIMLLLLRQETLTPQEIAERLDLARSTVEWHLSNLIEHGIVTKETRTRQDGTERLVVEQHDPSTVYRLLREIQPRISDRLVDRFSRLTDELLGD